MVKEELLAVRVTTELLEQSKAEAEKRDINLPEYVRQALDFFASFDPAFLAIMEKAAEISKLDIPTVIQNLLVFYMAKDQAEYNVNGPTSTYKSAFRFDETGLVTGEKLHSLVYAEQEKEAKAELKCRQNVERMVEALLKKAEGAVARKKEFKIPLGEIKEIASAMARCS